MRRVDTDTGNAMPEERVRPMNDNTNLRALQRADAEQRVTIHEQYAWCEANGLMPMIKAAAKRKPRNTPEQAALLSRVMKRPRS